MAVVAETAGAGTAGMVAEAAIAARAKATGIMTTWAAWCPEHWFIERFLDALHPHVEGDRSALYITRMPDAEDGVEGAWYTCTQMTTGC